MSSQGPPPPSSQSGPQGVLRARKLSLTTRQLPLSSTSQVSPSSTSTSPQDSIAAEGNLSEIGLGLMLDEAASSEGRPSVDRSARNVAGSSSRRGGTDETDQFFLATEESNKAASASTARRNSSSRLPQLSTVTSTSGATSSPLQIFTGSPHPSPSFPTHSPLPSPVPLPRPYSPHQAYNLSSTTSTAQPPPSSASASSTSFPMSRPPSYNTIMAGSSSSQAMDRGRSNGSDIHSRQQSLTSACPPATSTISGFATPKSDITAFSPVSSNGAARSWRTYDWGMPNEKGSSDEDVREGGKSRGDEVGIGSKILAIPNAILAIFLAPLTGTNPASSNRPPYSPLLNGSSSPSKPPTSGPPHSKRYPLIVRLFTISYLVFSFLFLTINLSSRLLSSESSDSLRAKLESTGGQEGWQLVRHYADGLGAKAGIDLSWAHYKDSSEETEESKLAEDDWGTIRRIGHPDRKRSD